MRESTEQSGAVAETGKLQLGGAYDPSGFFFPNISFTLSHSSILAPCFFMISDCCATDSLNSRQPKDGLLRSLFGL